MTEEGNHLEHSGSNAVSQPWPVDSSTPTVSSRFESSTGAAEFEILDPQQTTVQCWERCRKYSHHSHFIPASDFHGNHLPTDTRDADILTCIKLMTELTVRLRIIHECSSNTNDCSHEDDNVSKEMRLCTGLFSYFDIPQYVSRFERKVLEEYSESFDENDLDRIRQQVMLKTNNQELRAFVKNFYSESLRHLCLLLVPHVKTLETELRNPVFVELLTLNIEQCFEIGLAELDDLVLSGQDITDHLVASRSTYKNDGHSLIHPIRGRSDDAHSDDLATHTSITDSANNITSTAVEAPTNTSVGVPTNTSDDAPVKTFFDAISNTSDESPNYTADELAHISGDAGGTTPGEATTSVSVNALNSAPVNEPNSAPVNATNSAPVNATTSGPVMAPTTIPFNAATSAPVNAITNAPVNATTNTSNESTTNISTEATATMSEPTTNTSDDETSYTSEDETSNTSDNEISNILHSPTPSMLGNTSTSDDERDVRLVFPCPCPQCAGTSCPQPVGYVLQVLTDRRAILDNEEAKSAVVDVLFGGEVRHLYGQTVDRVGNYCDLHCLECVTHETDLALWIKGKSVAFNRVFKTVRSKVSSPVAVMCSYPHGHTKMISVGQWTARFPHVFGQTQPLEYVSYDYNIPSCPGCTGAPVLVLGQMAGSPHFFNEVQFHYGIRSDELNTSGAGLAIRYEDQLTSQSFGKCVNERRAN